MFAIGATLGCAGNPPVTPTGVLGDYSGFVPDEDLGNTLVYVNPDADLGRYERIIVEPVQVALSPDAASHSVDPADLAKLANYLHTALVVAVRDRYPVVDEPAADVLRVRVAITDVVPTKPVRSTAGTLLIPARVASAAKRAITGTDLFVGQVAIEAEAVDSLSDERLLGLVDRKAGNNFRLREGASTWAQIERAFREWALRFRTRLDAARAPEPTPDG